MIGVDSSGRLMKKSSLDSANLKIRSRMRRPGRIWDMCCLRGESGVRGIFLRMLEIFFCSVKRIQISIFFSITFSVQN